VLGGQTKSGPRPGNETGDGAKEVSRDQLEAEERRRREDRRVQKSGVNAAAVQGNGSERQQGCQGASDSAPGAGVQNSSNNLDVSVLTTTTRSRGGIRRGGRGINGAVDAGAREEKPVESAAAAAAESESAKSDVGSKQPSKSRDQGSVPGAGGKPGGRQQGDAASSPRPEAGADAGRSGPGQRFYRAGPTGEPKGSGKEGGRQGEDEPSKKSDTTAVMPKQAEDVDVSKLTPRVGILHILHTHF
jgi:hypothetical protein